VTELPPERPVVRRVDETSADVATLVDMGVIEEPPQPQYTDLFLEPDLPPHEDAA
jgi:hypothetical protein